MTPPTAYVAIIAIIERGKADLIVAAAQRAGASGATILFARGTGTEEHLSLFKLHVDAMKEVLIILTEESKADRIFAAVVDAGHLTKPGTGIAFILPTSAVAGLEFRAELGTS